MPIIAIAFYMVLIRVAINQQDRSFFSTIHADHEMGQGSSRHYPMKPLEVHISQFRHDAVENHDQQSTGKEECYAA